MKVKATVASNGRRQTVGAAVKANQRAKKERQCKEVEGGRNEEGETQQQQIGRGGVGYGNGSSGGSESKEETVARERQFRGNSGRGMGEEGKRCDGCSKKIDLSGCTCAQLLVYRDFFLF